MRHSALHCLSAVCFVAVIVGGAGCSKKQASYIESPASQKSEIRVEPNVEGGKAATGGASATMTPSIDSSILANALPSDTALTGFKASVAEERMNPVPMQDGTRSDFKTLTKEFSATTDNRTRIIRTLITDTRSIPVLTAFIDSYSEYSNETSSRTKINIKDGEAWLTYQKNEAEGYGSVVMLYRERFLIQIDGNLGVSKDDLISALNAYRVDQLK